MLQSAAASCALSARPAAMDIFQAATAGDVQRAGELIDADATIVRARSADGRTPLHFAASAGQAAMVTLLGAKGAELNAGPENPVLAAVDFPDHDAAWEMANFLLSNAADPNARRSDGRTALSLARARSYDDIVRLLLHRGAEGTGPAVERVHFDRRYLQDVHGRPWKSADTSAFEWTRINPFVTLAHFNFDKVKELATAAPGLIDTRASWDETAIEAASHTGQLPMAEWLAERGAAVSTCTAVLLGQAALVRAALAADPLASHERGAHDIAILAYTAYAREQAEIARLLLDAGAGVHERALGVSTLHLAAQKGYLDLAELLLARGADPNLSVKSRGQSVTPLALAEKANQPKMSALLRAKGAR